MEQSDKRNESRGSERFYGVPVYTVILLAALASLFAILSCSGPYMLDGWLFFVLAVASSAFLAYLPGCRIALVVPVIAVVIYSFIAASPVPVWAVLTVPAGYFLSLSMGKRIRLNTALVMSAAAVAVAIAAYFLLSGFGPEGFSKAAVISSIKAPFNEFRAIIDEYNALAGEELIKIDESYIRLMVNAVKMLCPALVICTALVISWLSLLCGRLIGRILGLRDKINRESVSMSTASAVMLIAAYFINLIFSYTQYDIITVAAENIAVILFPGFFAVGFGLLVRASKQRSGGGFLHKLYVGMAVLVLILSGGMITLLYIVVGIVYTFWKNFRNRKA